MEQRNRDISFACVVLNALVIVGCATPGATQEERPAAAVEPTGTNACFYERQVNDFRALDRSNLIVYAPSKAHAYHVRVSPPSTQLKFANALAFTSRSGRICGFAGDAIVMGTRPGERVSVIDVYRLDEIGLQRLLEAYGLAKGDEELEPETEEGAEIERDIDADEPQ